MNILDEIISHKRKEVASAKANTSVKTLESSGYFNRVCYTIVEAIQNNNSPSIIAEFKRKSPSRSEINLQADVLDTCLKYQALGATALSVLTDKKYFSGSNDDITTIRDEIHLPILRKEFIIDDYQIIEAKSLGADFILLIAECLSGNEVKSLARTAHDLGLQVLLEMHSKDQIDKINDDIDLIGVNNRNLETFETNIQTSIEMIKVLPKDRINISESGISNADEISILHTLGYKGFLIGETLMKDVDLLSTINKT